jgi:transposase
MQITETHREVAKLIWEGNLELAEIATLQKITERTIYNWKNKPEFDQLLKDLEDEHKSLAKREAIRWARRSVQTLIKLQDIKKIKDKITGETLSEEFKFGADVARKAACDLLEMAEVKVQKGETNVQTNIINVKELDDLTGDVHNGDIITRAEDIRRRANGAIEKRFAPIGDRFSEN